MIKEIIEKLFIDNLRSMNHEREYLINNLDDMIDNEIHLFMIDHRLSESILDIDIDFIIREVLK